VASICRCAGWAISPTHALSGPAQKKIEVRRGEETLTLTVVPEKPD